MRKPFLITAVFFCYYFVAFSQNQTVTGIGTLNNLSKFTSNYVIGPSSIYDNGSGVGIGIAAPAFPLDVNGAIRGTSTTKLDLSAFGAASTIYLRSSFYNRTNNFGALTVVNDVANGASAGFVDNFTVGWTGHSLLNRATGFSAGTYDVYVRVRTNGLGNLPTACSFVIYDQTTALSPLTTMLSSLSSTYKEVYAGPFTLPNAMLGNSILTCFSSSGITTNYYLDYVKIVPAPIFPPGISITNDDISTAFPLSKLALSSTLADPSASVITLERPVVIGLIGGVRFGSGYINPGNATPFWSGIDASGTGGADQMDLRFYTTYGGGQQNPERMRIDPE